MRRRLILRHPRRHVALCSTLCLVGVLAACSRSERSALDDGGVDAASTREALLNPETCRGCHPTHYEQWAGSMHAYASTDPVFLAMNRFGQADTHGDLGDFCVRCHAPLAVSEGLTSDGLNLASVPAYAQGVGCYFCHDINAVHRQNDNGVDLAGDTTLRGGISDPVENVVHRSTASDLFASNNPKSATLCGACHDVVTPAGVHLERTFKEWNGSLFGSAHAPSPGAVLSCNGCHMATSQGKVADIGSDLPERTLHAHDFAGVDLALTPFPDTGDAALDQRIATRQRDLVGALLDTSIGVEICVQQLLGEQFAVYVNLENASAGHNWPSGAAQDRRAWVEVVAYGEAATPLYQSGVAADGAEPDATEADLWQLGDRMLDASGNPVQMFWQARTVTSTTIPAPLSNDPSSAEFLASHVIRRFPKDPGVALKGVPQRVTVRVRMRPLGSELLDRLQSDAGLDAAVRDHVPTFDVIPNRHLAQDPTLASLASVTFEWSAATRSYPGFSTRTLNDDAFPKACVSMAPQR